MWDVVEDLLDLSGWWSYSYTAIGSRLIKAHRSRTANAPIHRMLL